VEERGKGDICTYETADKEGYRGGEYISLDIASMIVVGWEMDNLIDDCMKREKRTEQKILNSIAKMSVLKSTYRVD